MKLPKLRNAKLSMGISTLLAMAGVSILASCGGSGSSTQPTTTVQGKVIDGYIANATVCLDMNKNFVCDDGEPTTITDVTGSYTLSFSGSAANQIILAEAFTGNGVKDSDDSGKDLDQAGRSGFTLAAPASKASVISPLTTMITLDLLSNMAVPITDASINASEKNVQTSLHNTDAILGVDFISTKNKNMHQLATLIADLLPDIIAEVTSEKTLLLVNPSNEAQVSYKLIRDSIYKSMSLVVDFNNNDALKYSQGSALLNARVTAGHLSFSGSGANASVNLELPPLSLLNDLRNFNASCPAEISQEACFVRQLFVQ